MFMGLSDILQKTKAVTSIVILVKKKQQLIPLISSSL